MRKPRATKPARAATANGWKAAGLNKPAGGSSFVSCPVCGRSIHHALINTHLDSCQVDDAAQKVHQQAPVELKAASNGSASHSTSSTAGARLTQQGSQASSGARAGQLWPVFQQEGKSRPGRTAAATAHYPDGRQRQLTAEQLFGITPCELVPAALPASLATEVLQLLMADQAQFERMQWWMGSTAEPSQSSKSSCVYLLTQHRQAGHPSGGASSTSSSSSTADTRHGDAGSLERQQLAPAVLQCVGELMAAAVNERIAKGRAGKLLLEAADRGGWAPSYVIANCYPSGAEGVGLHSDRLTPLGPLPIIASLSLGATRTFRLHRRQLLASQDRRGGGAGSLTGAAALPSSAEAAGGSGGTVRALAAVAGAVGGAAGTGAPSRVDIPLPHNSLLLMWPPTQEGWKHEVPKTKAAIPEHTLSGVTRFNLTFRRLKPEWEGRAPQCKCGRQAVMKAWTPKQQQQQQQMGEGVGPQCVRYYYTCDNSRGPPCDYWLWGPQLWL